MIHPEQLSTVTTGYLVSKLGSHLTTGFLHQSSTDYIIKEMRALDFEINPEQRMQVFEKVGPSYFSSDAEMKMVEGNGISGYRYKNNECGETIAKTECFQHFVCYLKNTIYSNESRLKSIKGLCPVFILNKERKDSFQRLSKKIEIMKSIIDGNEEAIEKHNPVKDVYRLDPEKELNIITPLSEDQTFFYVNLNKFEIKQVKARMIGFRDYIIRSDKVDGYIEYGFFDNNSQRVHTTIIQDTSYTQSGEIAINSSKRFLFLNKEKALELLLKEKDRINEAIEYTMSAESE